MKLKKLFAVPLAFAMTVTSMFAADVYLDIEALESKKQELVSTRNGNPAQESEILYNARIEYEKASAAIDQEILRIAETDANGNILADVKKRRMDEKQALKNNIDQRAKEEIAALKNGDSSFEYQLVKEIQQMEAELKQERTIDSYDDPRILSINSYAGDKFYWNTVIRFYIGDRLIFNQNVNLDYQTLAGKAPAVLSKADEYTYNDYLDTVDYYDEVLKSNDGTIVARITYVVEAMDKSNPSAYKVTIKSIDFINLITERVIKTVTPVTSTYTFKMTPAIDIRTDEEKYSGEYSKNKTMTPSNVSQVQPVPSTSTTNKGTGNKTVTNPSSAPSKSEMLSKNTDGRFNLGVLAGSVPLYMDYNLGVECVTFDAYLTVPLTPNFYCSIETGVLPTPYAFGDFYNQDGNVFQISFGGGINYRLPFRHYQPNLFIGGAVGIGTAPSLYNNYYYTADEDVLLLVKFNCGIDFPIGKLIVLTTDYSMWWVEQAGLCYNYSFGVAIDLN